MENSKPFSIGKIIGFLFASVLLCLALCYVDNCIIKPHAIFIIEEYSAITLAIWPIQATLSTLSIAFLSIFVNRLEDRYYGLSVKDVLRLCVSWFGINFFEMIFVILLLNGVVAIAVMCNSMAACIAIGIVTLQILLNIVSVSLKIAMDEKFAEQLAKKYVKSLLDDVVKEATEARESALLAENDSKNTEMPYTNKSTEKQEKLINLAHKIIITLQQQILTNKTVVLEDDISFMFIIEIQMACRENIPVIEERCQTEMNMLMGELLRRNYQTSALDVSHWILADRDSAEALNTVRWICEFYYTKTFEQQHFDSFLTRLTSSMTQSLDTCLALALQLMFSICRNHDRLRWKQVMTCAIKGANNRNDLVYSEFLHATFAYMYYLAIKEPLYLDEYGKESLETLKSFTSTEMLIEGNPVKVIDVLKGEDYLIAIAEILKYNPYGSNPLRYRDLFVLGQARNVHIDGDIKEYVFFSIFTLYEHKKKILEDMDFNLLVELGELFLDDGSLKEGYCNAYGIFADWIGFQV